MTESDKGKVSYEFLKELFNNGFNFLDDNKNFLGMIMGDNGRFPYNYKSVKIEEEEENEDNQQYNVFVYQLLLYPPNINDKKIF